jgi:hypothetical protein
MPTGYTSMIKDNVTFKHFAMKCARAMGACITMREDPADIEIPIFEVNPYYKDKLKKATDEIKSFQKLSVRFDIPRGSYATDVEATVKARKQYKKEVADNESRIKENNDLLKKYNEMLRHVTAWQPPTPDHAHFKDFMTEQITGSIKFDCSNTYYLENSPKLLTGETWLETEIQKALRDIDYYTKEHEKEVERTNGRNQWIRQLKDSL